jgi:hypothetical protein
MRVEYEVDMAPGGVQMKSRASVAPPDPTGVAARKSWERRTLVGTFGASAGVALAD